MRPLLFAMYWLALAIGSPAAAGETVLRIDGSSHASAQRTFAAMDDELPPEKQLALRMAILQINLDGVRTAADAPQDLSAGNIRARIDGMSADEIIAEAAKAAAKEDAPRMELQIEKAPVSRQ